MNLLGFTRLRRIGLAVLVGTLPLLAQTTSPLPSHVAAAKELYRIIGGAATSQAAATAMLNAMTSQNPGLAAYRDVLEAWFKKVFSDGDFEGEMAALYTQYFSEKDLKDLIVYYQTELGKRVIVAMPQILQQGAMVGAKRAQAHTEELKSMLAEAMKQREPKPEPDKAEAPK